MTRVLYYGSSTQIHSGACQWMYRLADRMRVHGYRTTAILPQEGGIESWYQKRDIPVEYMWSEPIRRQRSALGQFKYLFLVIVTTIRLWLLIRRENIDIVHVNEVRFLPGLLAGAASNANTVCHVRICLESPISRKVIGGLAYALTDSVICVSERTDEMMFESVGYDDDKVRVVHDGLPSPERFDDLPKGTTFREEFDIDHGDFLVVSVSKLVRNKGQDRILDAARQFDEEDDVTFAIVGGTVEDHEEYAEELEERAKDMPDVRITGFYEDLPAVLGAADTLVHVPRHEDPFPGVLLEGMICGLPVIGSRSGGIPEQVEHGETGYIVPKRCGEKQIATYVSTLVTDEELCEQLGEKGKRRAFSQFDTEDYFEQIDAEYRVLTSV